MARTVGPYQLLERVGGGQLGNAFRAQPLGRDGSVVALKCVHPRLANEQSFVDRLAIEAQRARSLAQKNIVPLIDFGQADDTYYIASHWVDGIDLGRVLDLLRQAGRRMPVPVALHVWRSICHALQHAHRCVDDNGQPLNIVHGGLSPTNVLFAWNGTVFVTDFCLPLAASSSTAAGASRLRYVAPEQASGSGLDRRSDLFSAAMVAYECLVGHSPYEGSGDLDLLQRVLQADVPPSRAIDPDLPEELAAALDRGLAAAPDGRYQSATEMVAAVDSYALTAAPSWTRAQLSRWLNELSSLSITATDPPRASSSSSESASAETGDGPQRVLLIDDSATIRQAVKMVLAGTNLSVTSLPEATSALQSARERQPAVVLADLSLPGEDGYAICQKIRNDPALGPVPVVLLHGSGAAPYDPLRARQVGATSELAKPFSSDELLGKLESVGVSVAAQQGDPSQPQTGSATRHEREPERPAAPLTVPSPSSAARAPLPPPPLSSLGASAGSDAQGAPESDVPPPFALSELVRAQAASGDGGVAAAGGEHELPPGPVHAIDADSGLEVIEAEDVFDSAGEDTYDDEPTIADTGSGGSALGSRPDHASSPAEFGSHPAEFGSHPAEFGSHPAEFGSYPAEFGSYPAEFGSHPADFDSEGPLEQTSSWTERADLPPLDARAADPRPAPTESLPGDVPAQRFPTLTPAPAGPVAPDASKVIRRWVLPVVIGGIILLAMNGITLFIVLRDGGGQKPQATSSPGPAADRPSHETATKATGAGGRANHHAATPPDSDAGKASVAALEVAGQASADAGVAATEEPSAAADAEPRGADATTTVAAAGHADGPTEATREEPEGATGKASPNSAGRKAARRKAARRKAARRKAARRRAARKRAARRRAARRRAARRRAKKRRKKHKKPQLDAFGNPIEP